jgi:DNA-binding FrmR family transcriptional regulator
MSCQKHENSVRKLKIARGQIDGIVAMLENDRGCIEVLNQITAALSAINSVRSGMLTGCIKCCLEETFTTEDNNLKANKIEELKSLLKKY